MKIREAVSGWWTAKTTEEKQHTVVRAATVVAALIVFAMIAGCQSYSASYAQYVDGCKLPQNNKTITVPMRDGSGKDTGALVINQGCALAAPVDADAKWVGLAGSLGGAAVQAVGQVAVLAVDFVADEDDDRGQAARALLFVDLGIGLDGGLVDAGGAADLGDAVGHCIARLH